MKCQYRPSQYVTRNLHCMARLTRRSCICLSSYNVQRASRGQTSRRWAYPIQPRILRDSSNPFELLRHVSIATLIVTMARLTPALETRLIAGYSTEMSPYPFEQFLALLYAEESWRHFFAEHFEFISRHLVVRCHIACPEVRCRYTPPGTS